MKATCNDCVWLNCPRETSDEFCEHDLEICEYFMGEDEEMFVNTAQKKNDYRNAFFSYMNKFNNEW